MTKRVACINDLSGLGRCSLTAGIAVLSAMGLQACPLPTAVLSAQTAFEGHILRDLTEDLESFPAHWQQMGMTFQGICSGFLATHHQIKKVEAILDRFGGPGVLTLVDPVLGDNGAPYPFCTPALIEEMRRLAARADILTPNLTEAFLLTGKAYHKNADVESAKTLAAEIAAGGAKNVVLTGVPDGSDLCNVVHTPAGVHVLRSRRLRGSYSGTGDLFAAVLCGAVLRGAPLKAAAALAARFISESLAATPPEADPRHGVDFEKKLFILAKEAGTWENETD